MAEHTPGPWAVFNKSGVVAIIRPDNKEVIHWCGFDSSDFPNAARANARLIAKAWLIPELVEALEDLISRFVKCAVASGTDPEFAEVAVEPHRAILAKANQPEN